MLRLLQIQTIAVAMEMRRKKKKAQRRFYMRSIFAHQKNTDYYHYQPGSHSIIVYCKHITHAWTHARTHTHTHTQTHTYTCTHTHTLAHTHTPTHSCCRSGCCCSMSRWRPTMTELTSRFRRFRWRSMAGRCFIQIQIQINFILSAYNIQ